MFSLIKWFLFYIMRTLYSNPAITYQRLNISFLPSVQCSPFGSGSVVVSWGEPVWPLGVSAPPSAVLWHALSPQENSSACTSSIRPTQLSKRCSLKQFHRTRQIQMKTFIFSIDKQKRKTWQSKLHGFCLVFTVFQDSTRVASIV